VAKQRSWSASIELRGAGGEPVDFARTLLSHGVADLPPNSITVDGSRLETVLLVGDHAWPVGIVPDGPAEARLDVPHDTTAPTADVRAALLAQARHMFRLDEDLSGFYAVAANDPALAWVTLGAGRMLRAPTVFEDLIKTICTTNCTWSATERMVGALVSELGSPAGRSGATVGSCSIPGRVRSTASSAVAHA
jgi:3-methyladenine DNA glycosylase/8-oxoguanine DNA glycosylase